MSGKQSSADALFERIDADPDLVAQCIGCGCDDLNACQPGGCKWLMVDRELGLGVCSNCAGCLGDYQLLLSEWGARAMNDECCVREVYAESKEVGHYDWARERKPMGLNDAGNPWWTDLDTESVLRTGHLVTVRARYVPAERLGVVCLTVSGIDTQMKSELEAKLGQPLYKAFAQVEQAMLVRMAILTFDRAITALRELSPCNPEMDGQRRPIARPVMEVF